MGARTYMCVSAFSMTHDGVHALLKRLLTSVFTSGIQPERQIEEERRIIQIPINHISTSTSCDLGSSWCFLVFFVFFFYASTQQTTWKNSSAPAWNTHTEPAASRFWYFHPTHVFSFPLIAPQSSGPSAVFPSPGTSAECAVLHSGISLC